MSFFDLKVLDNLYEQADIFIQNQNPSYIRFKEHEEVGKALKKDTNQKLTSQFQSIPTQEE